MEGGRTSPRRREPKNRHPAATRLPRIGSNDPAVPAEAASPAPSPRVRQRDDGLSPTERRNLSVGDIITWDVLKVPAGSPESRPRAATGTISGLYEGGVLIDRNRAGWPDFRIPTDAITSRFIVNHGEVEQLEPPRRRLRRAGQKEAGAAKAASTRVESAVTRQLRSEIDALEAQMQELTENLRKATQAKHSAKGFQKSAGERKLEQARDEIKGLQAELLEVNREVQHYPDDPARGGETPSCARHRDAAVRSGAGGGARGAGAGRQRGGAAEPAWARRERMEDAGVGGIGTAPSVLANPGVLQRLQLAVAAGPAPLALSSRSEPVR